MFNRWVRLARKRKGTALLKRVQDHLVSENLAFWLHCNFLVSPEEHQRLMAVYEAVEIVRNCLNQVNQEQI